MELWQLSVITFFTKCLEFSTLSILILDNGLSICYVKQQNLCTPKNNTTCLSVRAVWTSRRVNAPVLFCRGHCLHSASSLPWTAISSMRCALHVEHSEVSHVSTGEQIQHRCYSGGSPACKSAQSALKVLKKMTKVAVCLHFLHKFEGVYIYQPL